MSDRDSGSSASSPAHRRLADAVSAPAAVLSLDGVILHANPRLETLLRVGPGRLAGTPGAAWIAPEALARYDEMVRGGGDGCVGELRLRAWDGEACYAQLCLRRAALPEGEVLVLVAVDITPHRQLVQRLERQKADLEREVRERTEALVADVRRRQRTEADLQTALTQKEGALADNIALVREVHHRVKNNLQMLCDMLYLQMETVAPDHAGVLLDAYGRAYAIARLHEQLYQSVHGGRVDLAEYLGRLAGGYEMLYPQVPVRLTAREAVFLDLDRAVHLGLIANELVTNALKHAFPDGRSGEVHVHLWAANHHVHLQVRDDGVGWPPGVSLEEGKTLGLRIVRLLVRRLAGVIQLEHNGGVSVRLRFPLEADERAAASS